MATVQFNKLPIFLKAQEVFKISRAISCFISDNENILKMGYSAQLGNRFAHDIVMESLALAPELALLQNSESPSKRSGHIMKIRKAIKNILIKSTKLEFRNGREKEFLLILKSEILQFDRLFTEWTENFQYKKGLQ